MATRGGKRENAGRKSKDEEQRIRTLLTPYVQGAIETIANIAENGEKDSDKLSASKLILEYVFGKAKESIEINSPDPLIFKLPKNGD
jgi:hypothetical protein